MKLMYSFICLRCFKGKISSKNVSKNNNKNSLFYSNVLGSEDKLQLEMNHDLDFVLERCSTFLVALEILCIQFRNVREIFRIFDCVFLGEFLNRIHFRFLVVQIKLIVHSALEITDSFTFKIDLLAFQPRQLNNLRIDIFSCISQGYRTPS